MTEWKDVAGYEGRYQVSWLGEVRRLYKRSPPRLLAKEWRRPRKGSAYLRVHLYDGRGGARYEKVSRLVALAFLGPVPEGMRVIHRNGILSDDRAANLALASNEELGRWFGGDNSRRRAVAKIGRDGSVLDLYRSAREAERRNPCSYQAVLDRCNGRLRRDDEFEPQGYSFRYEEGR